VFDKLSFEIKNQKIFYAENRANPSGIQVQQATMKETGWFGVIVLVVAALPLRVQDQP
jgi:hypothetical protein